jgi:hypothetical protein
MLWRRRENLKKTHRAIGFLPALLATSAAGLATNVASNAISGAISGGGGGYSGGGIVEFPQYPWTRPRLELTSDYITSGLQNLQEGKPPPYLQRYLPEIEADLQRGLKRTYLGRPGERSNSQVGIAQQTGAITGVGPKATQANVDKVMKDYAEKQQSIDAYINSIIVDTMRRDAVAFPQISSQQPIGPASTLVQPQQIPQRPDYIGQSLNAIAGAVPWEDLFSGGAGVGSQQNPANNPFLGGYTYGYGPSGTGVSYPQGAFDGGGNPIGIRSDPFQYQYAPEVTNISWL